MLRLKDALSSNRKAPITQVISGLGGIGKTALAVEYAHRYAEQYTNIFIVNAESQASLSNSYRAIAIHLGIRQSNLLEDEFVIDAVLQYLNSAEEVEISVTPYLLILDNADFGTELTPAILKAFLPNKPTGHLILTTRNRTLHGSLGVKAKNIVRLDVLEPAEAVWFLCERVYGSNEGTPESEVEVIEVLASELGYLPLALEQAGAFIATNQGTFRNYLRLFSNAPILQLEKSRPDTGGYESSVARTWNISFTEVEKICPAATDFLRFCAFIAPEGIPIELALLSGSGAIPSLTDFFGVADDEAANEENCKILLSYLLRYSLVKVSVWRAECIDIHRLVQSVLQWSMSIDDCEKWKRLSILILTIALPPIKFENWAYCERLIIHHVAASKWALEDKLQDPVTSRMLNQTALYFFHSGKFEVAEFYFDEVLSINRATLDERHVDLAGSLTNLAWLYETQGRYLDAEPLMVEALAIYRANVSEDDISIFISLNNLASLYESLGRYDEAGRLFVEVLEKCRCQIPEPYLDIARTLNNLSSVYMRQERLGEAESAIQEALSIRRQILPEYHPDIAASLNNLAGLYGLQGRIADAEPLLVEAVAIDRQSLPPLHPDIASSLNNLAANYASQNRYEDAEVMYHEALSILSERLSEMHPSVANSLNNLAELYVTIGRYEDAEPLLVKALSINRKVLPEGHPSIASSLTNLSALRSRQGDYREAEILCLESLSIRRKILPAAHSDILHNLICLAKIYTQQARYDEAENLYINAIKTDDFCLSEQGENFTIVLHNLGAVYTAKGDYAKAVPLFQKAFSLLLSSHGKDDPLTQKAHHTLAMSVLAKCLQKYGLTIADAKQFSVAAWTRIIKGFPKQDADLVLDAIRSISRNRGELT